MGTASHYLQLAEQVSDSVDRDSLSRARLGVLISVAIMRRDGGRYDDYAEGLSDALIMAEQEGFEDVVLVLDALLGGS